MKKFMLNAIIIITSIGGYAQVMVKNIEPGANSSYPSNFYPFKDKLIFSASTNFNGSQVYITDGTASGTIQLTNFACANCTNNWLLGNTTNPFPYSGNVAGMFTDIDSLGYFFGQESQLNNGSTTYSLCLYKTDGTTNGTKKITSSNDTLNSSGSRFFKWNNMICAFVTKGNSSYKKLFVYNPINKTYYYKDFNWGNYTWINKEYFDIGGTPFVYNNCLYYYRFSLVGMPDSSLFSMDFTGNVTFKTILPTQFNTNNNGSNSDNNNYMIINNRLLFSGSNSSIEPYFYDFTTNTTGLLKDVNPYFNYGSAPGFIKYSYFHKTSEKLGYFFAYNPDEGKELYVTDGTPAGTILTRNTFNGTLGFDNSSPGIGSLEFKDLFHYHGDTIFSVWDSIRYYYKNSYYKAYKNPTITWQNNLQIEAYFSVGTTDFYHNINIYNRQSGRMYNTTNPNFSDSLNTFNCSLTLNQQTSVLPSNQSTYTLANALFLKKDSCYYLAQQNCNSSSLTGYELYRYCNKSMFAVGINELSNLQNHVSVYPNPSTSQFNFSGLVGENTIQITDIMGRALLTENTYTENHTSKLDAAQGIYFYKITDKKNRVQQGKIILQ